LIIAWPHRNDPFGGIKIDCKRGDIWAKTLADSPRLTIFAYITPERIETSTQKCRHAVVPPVEDLASLIRKSLSSHDPKLKSASISALGRLRPKPNQTEELVLYPGEGRLDGTEDLRDLSWAKALRFQD